VWHKKSPRREAVAFSSFGERICEEGSIDRGREKVRLFGGGKIKTSEKNSKHP